MQVRHETQLIEPSALQIWTRKSQLNDTNNRQSYLLDSYTLLNSFGWLNPIEQLAVSTPTGLLAVYLNDSKQVALIDTKTQIATNNAIVKQLERFPLKACDKKYSKQTFTVKGIDFSPDGQRLAIGQTDCIVYIYKLPQASLVIGSSESQPNQLQQQPNQRPTITGKFVCSSPTTCLIWANCGIIFGCQDGRIKLVSFGTKRNSSTYAQDGNSSVGSANANPTNQLNSSSMSQARVVSLYNSPKASMPICLAYKSSIVIVGFGDHSILALTIPADLAETSGSDASIRRASNSAIPSSSIVEHTCPATHISAIQVNSNNLVCCCAGSDGKISLYRIQWGIQDSSVKLAANTALAFKLIQTIDLNDDVQALDYSSVNELIVIATLSRIVFVKYDQELSSWQLQGSFIELNGSRAVTSVLWMRDGSQLAVGTLMGSLELFQCSWSKQTLSDQLDICHIAKNRVRITDRARNLLATFKTQSDIRRVNVLDRGQSVIIWSNTSLLVASLELPNYQSELRWPRDNKANQYLKFCFDYSGLVMIYNQQTHELHVIKLGQDSILFSVKPFGQNFQTVNKKLISVRRHPPIGVASGFARSSNNVDPNSVDFRLLSFRRRSSADTAEQQQINPELLNLSQEINSDSLSQPNSNENLYMKLAYVIDDSSLVIVDLHSETRELSLKLDRPLNWLEFSHTSTKLAYIDKVNRLHLLKLNVVTCEWQHLELLKECEFSSWLPETDILVAQSGYEITIWFNLNDVNALGSNASKTQNIERLDSRSYNINHKPPIIDLSLFSRDQKQAALPLIVNLDSNSISLSNGVCIKLDRVKVKFYTELIKSVSSALEVLETNSEFEQQNVTTTTAIANFTLWSRLLWIAIEMGECRVASRVANKLAYLPSWANFLDVCQTCEPIEKQIRLALLRGQWSEFERLAEPDRIQATYRRLNKWSRLLQYLTQMQQFRQRDLAERDFRAWLLARGRVADAARLLVKSGNLREAIELLESSGKVLEATEMLLQEIGPNETSTSSAQQSLLDLAEQLKNRLIEQKQFKLAANLSYQILNQADEAIELYLRESDFEPAISIAKVRLPVDRVDSMRESYAQFLLEQFNSKRLSKRQASKAVDQLLEAHKPHKALEVAIKLNDITRAYKILTSDFSDTIDSKLETDLTGIKEICLVVGDHYATLGTGEVDKALEAYRIGGHYDKMFNLCLDRGDLSRAYEISLKYLHNGNQSEVGEFFEDLAQQLIRDNKPMMAEQIYLKLLKKPQLAIQLERQLKNYDRLLDLVHEYEPDQLEEQLLIVAKELESAGRLDEAERYLLRVSEVEWTNVVRMYRLASKWDQAFRVAKEHCGSDRDPLLVQLAFWWAKSFEDASLARELLFSLNLFKPVVELCCENRNFRFALNICSNLTRSELEKIEARNSQLNLEIIEKLKNEIISRQATYFEQQNQFDQAESVLVESGRLKDAIAMYIGNERYTDAVRVIEKQLESSKSAKASGNDELNTLLNDTLIKCADKISIDLAENRSRNPIHLGDKSHSPEDQAKLMMAQQMYLRAQRPDLAIEMYQNRGLWHEAVQLAQRFAPQLIEKVEQALDVAVSKDLGPIMASTEATTTGPDSIIPVNNKKLLDHQYKSLEKQIGFPDSGESNPEAIKIEQEINNIKMNLKIADEASADRDFSHILETIQLAKPTIPLSLQLKRLKAIVAMFKSASQNSLWPRRLADLAERMLSYCSWGNPTNLNFLQDVESFGQLRSMLSNCMDKLKSTTDSFIKPKFILVHFVCLQGVLIRVMLNMLARKLTDQKQVGRRQLMLSKKSHQQQSKVLATKLTPQNAPRFFEQINNPLDQELFRMLTNSIVKLSVSLSRVQPDSMLALYVAGLWLLVAKKPQLARRLWTKLLEAVDSGSKRAEFRLAEEQIDDVRAWLLESLMDMDEHQASSKLENGSSELDESVLKSIIEGKQMNLESGKVCLASGLPIEDDESLRYNHSSYFVREQEWKHLIQIHERCSSLSANNIKSTDEESDYISLGDSVELIARLTGHKKNLL